MKNASLFQNFQTFIDVEKYLSKHRFYPDLISQSPHKDLFISVVIPCYNEPNLIRSFMAILNCKPPQCAVEVIVVINSSESSSDEIKEINHKTYIETAKWIEKHNKINSKLQFHITYFPNLPKKFAGVGLARKAGMDEAVSRFCQLRQSSEHSFYSDGIIVGFDADSLCDDNYLIEIEKYFISNPKANACSIYFEHPVVGNEFPVAVYQRIIQYELYLRYYIQAQKYVDFPYAYHTIGSSFAVKASVYCKQGGMNRRKAGEDFYFLQKIIPLGNYGELNTTKVIPSPRPSDRVPFGTGAAISKLINNTDTDYLTYNFEAFVELKHFFSIIENIYKSDKNKAIELLMQNKTSQPIINFLKKAGFFNDLSEINKNSPNIITFRKRFFQWFNAFRILKYLNFVHESSYEFVSIVKASNDLLIAQKLAEKAIDTELDLLNAFKTLDRFG